MPVASAVVSVREARERTISRLTDAFAVDDLELEEFERRISLAHRAESLGELEPLVADLPAASASTALVGSNPTSAVTVRRAGTGRRSQTMVNIMSGSERKGRWSAPQEMRIVNVMGGAHLDFREAELAPGETHLFVFCLMGGCEVIVPPGLAVDMDGISIMGGFEHLERAPTDRDPNAPYLRISGFVAMGGVNVTTRLVGESERDARRRQKAERKALRAADRERRQLGGRP
jgi:hypothetical protein